jgi:hypothetical protein
MSGRDELLRKQYAREVEKATTFAARMHAREKLFSHGWGEDPWRPEALDAELDRAAQAGVLAALEDAGRVLLFDERFELLEAWLGRIANPSREALEAMSAVRGMIAIRQGDNEAADAWLTGVPLEEAVALHGLALLQLGRAGDAAARLEVLLAADVLDEQGELAPRFLPEATPVLALFLTACVTAAERHLDAGERASATKFAFAARDALRRYAEAEPPEGPTRAEVGELLQRLSPS